MKEPTPLRPRTVPIAAADGYRLWSQTYDTDTNALLALEARTLGSRLNGIEGKFVVDVGCGTGRWMAHAATKLAAVAGVDLCMEMLCVAARKRFLHGSVAQADCHALPFRDAIADIAICSLTLGYVHDPALAVRELARITRRGGIVLVTELHPETRARGWRRTFRVGQSVYELQAFPIEHDRLLDYARGAGLELRHTGEPHMGKPEALLMQQAGKGEMFAEVSGIPALLCVEWERA